MPALSCNMTEGKIVSWAKSKGDVLSKGESVVMVKSNNVDMDVKTFHNGILAAIVGEGKTTLVGATIRLLAETKEEVVEAKAKAAQSGSFAHVADVSVAPTPPPSTSNPALVIA